MSASYSDIVVRVYNNFASFPTSLPLTSPFALDKSTGTLYYWDGTSYETLDTYLFVPYTGATGDVDLGTHDIYSRNILGLSKTFTYNIDGTLNVVTDAIGTKTMAYNLDGTLASVTGTGIYPSKTFNYVGGVLTGVTVL